MTSVQSRRLSSFVGLLFCISMLLTAFILQERYKLVPCPLCILQRYITGTVAFGFLIGSLAKKNGWFRIASVMAFIMSVFGMLVSGRQVWLQSLPPDSVPACGPDLDFMVRHMPFKDTLKLLYQGSGDCARVDWQLLHLSLPAWTLIAFMLMTIYSLLILMRYGRADALS